MYHICDYHTVPPQTLAVLIEGLGPNTRYGANISGLKVPLDTVLLAVLVDDFNAYLNAMRRHPKSIESVAKDFIFGERKSGFSTVKELENAMKKFKET